jgi:hypothetical protein
MSTPPFLESPRFPDNIAFGATVGPTYQTTLPLSRLGATVALFNGPKRVSVLKSACAQCSLALPRS